MNIEYDKRLAFDLADMRESDVLVYSVSFSGNAYGRDTSGKNQGPIFFHKSQTEKFDIKPGDMVRARYVPNYEDRRDSVPWRTIFIFPLRPSEERGIAELVQTTVMPPAPEPAPTPVSTAKKGITLPELKAQIEELVLSGQVWTSREVFYQLFKREVDYKRNEDKLNAASIGNHLRALCRAGKMSRMEIYRHDIDSAHSVYFSVDLDALKPEGY
jgi:hypothetical protein